MANWLTAEVVGKKQWTERLFSLYIKCEFSEFTPGQFIRVALDINGERIARPYSLVNTPDEELLEIYFNIVPDGPLSSELARLETGDRVYVGDRANGFLTIDEVPECRHLWLLATGTGIGPFISMLKSDVPWSRFEKIALGYSVRNYSELSYRETLSKLEDRHGGQFSFVPFVTREKIAGTMNCRIPASVEDGSFEKTVGIQINQQDSHIMLCGNSAMIGSVTECLKARGLRKHLRREPGHITMEKYH